MYGNSSDFCSLVAMLSLFDSMRIVGIVNASKELPSFKHGLRSGCRKNKMIALGI